MYFFYKNPPFCVEKSLLSLILILSYSQYNRIITFALVRTSKSHHRQHSKKHSCWPILLNTAPVRYWLPHSLSMPTELRPRRTHKLFSRTRRSAQLCLFLPNRQLHTYPQHQRWHTPRGRGRPHESTNQPRHTHLRQMDWISSLPYFALLLTLSHFPLDKQSRCPAKYYRSNPSSSHHYLLHSCTYYWGYPTLSFRSWHYTHFQHFPASPLNHHYFY